MAEENRSTGWFWTAFGGTIIGILGLLLGTILTFFNNNITTLRAEISNIQQSVAMSEGRREVWKERSISLEVSLQKMEERIVALEQQKESYKEKFDSLMKMIETLKESDKEIKTEEKNIQDKISATNMELKALSERMAAKTAEDKAALEKIQVELKALTQPGK